MKKLLVLIVALAMVLSLAACGSKQTTTTTAQKADGTTTAAKSDFPKFAITINTSKSGSNVDIMARLFTKYANKYCAQNIVVNSCSGQVAAAREAKNAAADGYTLAMTNTTVIINDVVGETDFNAVDDFSILGIAIDNIANWICVKADFAKANNISSLKDLYDYTQAHPDELLISDRLAANTNVVVEQMKAQGFKLGSADVGLSTDRLTNFLAGNVQVALLSWNIVEQYVTQGDVVCLAVCNEVRSEFTPDIPTTYEQGYQVACPTSYYLYGPKNLPADVVEYLNTIVQKVVADPEFIAECKNSSVEAHPSQTAAEATAALQQSRTEMIQMGLGTGYQK